MTQSTQSLGFPVGESENASSPQPMRFRRTIGGDKMNRHWNERIKPQGLVSRHVRNGKDGFRRKPTKE